MNVLASIVLWIYTWWRTIKREVGFVFNLIKSGIGALRIVRSKESTIDDFWRSACRKYGNNILFCYRTEKGEEKQMTFNEVDELACQLANWAKSQGFKENDRVALLMENKPEFIAFVMAMGKIGVTTALLNTQITNNQIGHLIQRCRASRLVYSSFPADLFQNVTDVELIEYCSIDYSKHSKSFPKMNLSGTLKDAFVYIFTSGTTGLPKAAKISNLRFCAASLVPYTFLNITAKDRIMLPLPLYHASALIIGFGTALHTGCSLIIRKKFSTSNFFKDCSVLDATIIQYIGEICRYLCNSDSTVYDTSHHVRLAIGNGLKKDVWLRFQNRFKVPQIAEFYAATEGTVGFINSENVPGAIGFISPFLRLFHPARFVKLDEHGEIYRNKNGFCQLAGANEVAHMISLVDNKTFITTFDGYVDSNESNSKLIKNVFRKGDLYYKSGDVMKLDKEGFIYFVDRTGDTFRWKGENVSTLEVEKVILDFVPCRDCMVYGVSIPKAEGKIGMTLLQLTNESEIESTLALLVKLPLPKYAMPYFCRITFHDFQITGTFKHKKAQYQEEGFKLKSNSNDKIFIRQLKGNFVPLSENLLQDLENGRLQF